MASTATTTKTASKATTGNGRAKKSAESDAYEDLSIQVAALKTDLANLTAAIGDIGRAEKSRLANVAKDTRDAVKERGEKHAQELKQTTDRYLRDGETFVRENPATALGIVAGIGFLFGLLSRR